jgi:histidine triad (HIT) family protein
MSDCLFCKLVAGDIPSRRIYDDGDFIAFLDIFPANRGHTLVIPRAHFDDIHSMSAENYGALASRAKVVADLLADKLGSEGTTIFQMNKSAGWQTVFHAHMHVIPRWHDDALHKPWDIAPATDSDLEKLQREILS